MAKLITVSKLLSVRSEMSKESQFASVSIRPELREKLREQKRGGETYSSVIERLLQRDTRENESTKSGG